MSVRVLNIPLFDRSLEEAARATIDICLKERRRENRLVSATGAHGLVEARRHDDFGEVLNHFFWNLPDGMPAVWVGRLKGAKHMRRCYGPDFFAAVMKQSSGINIRHFLCGGKEGVADDLRGICLTRFKNANCVGTFSPPFRDLTDAEFASLGELIRDSGCDIVWIGLSTPKQEIFACRLAEYVRVHFIITVGAAFDFHTGRIRQAPSYVQRAGLEWLFRLLMEPRRLSGRYAQVVPLFIGYALQDLINSKFSKT